MSRKEEPRVTPRKKARLEIEAKDWAEVSDADSEREDKAVGEVWPLIRPRAFRIFSFV